MGMPYRLLDELFLTLPYDANNNIVLEIGSERGEGSSLWLHNWANDRNIEFFSIDVVENHMRETHPFINFVTCKSGHVWCRDILPTLHKKIKVLYLDNFDWITNEWLRDTPDWIKRQQQEYLARGVEMNNDNCQEEHRLQTLYCMPYMDPISVIIMDDTSYDLETETWTGKCATAIPVLEQWGFIMHGDPKFGKYASRNCTP